MTEIDAPRVPGVSTGVVALALALIPALWIGVFLMLGGVADAAAFRETMLMAEPFALPVIGAVGVVIALFALWRDTRVGRTLALIAIGAIVLQTLTIVALILL